MNLTKMKLVDIIPYERNPRKNDTAAKEVATSIRECGYCNPIIVDEDHVVLAGHTRLKALNMLGWDECYVIIKDGLSEEEKIKYRIYDNKVSEFADWDYEKLAVEMEDLDFSAYDIDWGIIDEEYGNTDFVNKEYGDDDFADEDFEYECPECGFMFNK